MNKERNGSIELLRILLMLMIIAYHWELHAGGDSICSSTLTANQVLSFAIGSWGTLAVDVFFIISAFFLCKDNKIDPRKLISTTVKVSVYGTLICVFSYAFGLVQPDLVTVVKSVLGIFAYQYWFMTVYVILYAVHPALNCVIDNLPIKYLYFICCVMFISTYLVGFVFLGEFLGRLASAITIYLIIGVLEKIKINTKMNKKITGGGTALLIICTIFLEIGLSYVGNNYNASFFKVIIRIQENHSPLMLLIAIGLFYSFLNINMRPNKIILFLAKYSIGAYMIHGGASFLKTVVWDGIFKAGFYYDMPFSMYAPHYLICVLILFAAGVLAEFIYCHSVEKLIYRMYDKIHKESIRFRANE